MKPLLLISLVVGSVLSLNACSKEAAIDALDLDHEDVFALKVGECFNDEENDDEVDSLPMRDCNEPHDNEAYFIFNLEDTPTMPSEEVKDEMAETRCEAEFTKFIGIEYADSVYDYGTLTPTQSTWDDGDREVVCFLYHSDGDKMTTSMKGAGA